MLCSIWLPDAMEGPTPVSAQERRVDVEEPEDDPAERALRGGDEETAFHRCPRDFGELAEEQLFAVIPEGQGLDEEFLYLGAVHEQLS